MHVERDGTEAEVWITPEARVAYNDGLNARTLRELAAMVEANRDRIEEAWRGFLG